MDTAQIWATVLTAVGAGAILRELAAGLVKWLTGSAGRERGRNADLVTQRDDAYARLQAAEVRADEADARADAEARKRRLVAEYASALRRDCVEHGMTPEGLRPWPVTD